MKKAIVIQMVSMTLILLLSYGQLTNAAVDSFWQNLSAAKVEIDYQSNYVNLGLFGTSALRSFQTEINSNHQIPNTVDNRIFWELRIPFHRGQKDEWGGFIQTAAWGKITGDSADFYHDFHSDDVPGGFYDLGARMESYNIIGLYKQSELTSLGNVRMNQKIYAVLNYQDFTASGQGIVRTTGSGKEAELHAIYEKTWKDPGNVGYGAGLDWGVDFQLAEADRIYIKIANLPGIAFISNLKYENGRADAIENEDGPVVVNGFTRTKEDWILLSALTHVEYTHSMWGGNLILTADNLGEITDFSLGYSHNMLLDKLNGTISYNPVMKNVALGCSWKRGTMQVFLKDSGWQVRGLRLGINY